MVKHLGARLARRRPGEILWCGFAWFLAAVAGYMMLKGVGGGA